MQKTASSSTPNGNLSPNSEWYNFYSVESSVFALVFKQKYTVQLCAEHTRHLLAFFWLLVHFFLSLKDIEMQMYLFEKIGKVLILLGLKNAQLSSQHKENSKNSRGKIRNNQCRMCAWHYVWQFSRELMTLSSTFHLEAFYFFHPMSREVKIVLIGKWVW